MNELSVTVTAGIGSERHNHDLSYRKNLDNCHERPDAIIELIPYEKTYAEQINELMKTHIDNYNKRVNQRYKLAWERYNSGQIKTKPRKRDYQHMSYDYYAEHIDDKKVNPVTKKEEPIPIYRELIIGIGDRQDRLDEKITEDQAVNIFSNALKQFQVDFPCFKILGCTVHLDEEGFYHCHLDYKPLYDRPEGSKGLEVGVGLDGALESMGYEREQSIINSRDKVPLLFNAMRNKIYYNLEEQMAAEGLYLQYGVSGFKEPDKDSSRKQSLRDWQIVQDKARELQHEKNVAMNVISGSKLSMEDYNKAIESFENIEKTMDEISQSQRSRLNKNNVLVNYNLFDQLQSFLKELRDTFSNLLHALDIARHNAVVARENLEYIKTEYVSPEEYQDLKNKYIAEIEAHNTTKRRLRKALADSADKSTVIKEYGLEDILKQYQRSKKGLEH